MTQHSLPRGLARRHALTGAATVAIGLPLLAACGGDDGGDAGGGAAADDPAADSTSPAPSDDPGSGGSGAGGGGLVAASEVAVGSGVVLAAEQLVVTQPSEGEFKAFSAICTHQGCPVEDVVDGQIHCPCHQSMFSIEDGSPQSGPATAPLDEVPITVEGGRINLA
ncbi:Rieske (2Fe-2S) protein [Nocardioides ferulae]|uniref:Rieske (2Fe-2S) protein n=1 Tax=Nocardioides ferulae TaxID=2340821 RepID=UPI001F0C4D75|nr:Rieske (2Fe-2S) protein [Nocardioides ferulae]